MNRSFVWLALISALISAGCGASSQIAPQQAQPPAVVEAAPVAASAASDQVDGEKIVLQLPGMV